MRALPTLGLAGDGDDAELLDALERAFGLALEDAAPGWRRVGDILDTLRDRLGPGEEGEDGAEVALRRLAAALPGAARWTGTLTADTPLRRVVRWRSARAVLRRTGRETGLRMPPVPMGMAAVGALGAALLGVLALVLGLPGWLGVPPVLGGVILALVNPGGFGRDKAGDLARRVAAWNFAALARDGADSRPRALRDAALLVIALEMGLDPRRIGPGTRLRA